ncbi:MULTISPECIES: hypothetical protein [unclassified Moorena]|uniref:hypothetical protein n=1 Tax=unclassified Moorena TaxID=2683338 RepID=UPI0026003362|nr:MULTISPECIES: hypothetical protein [unclassified Moorena]
MRYTEFFSTPPLPTPGSSTPHTLTPTPYSLLPTPCSLKPKKKVPNPIENCVCTIA